MTHSVQLETPQTDAKVWLTTMVLLPFAAGYYLSYLFRTINALIADALRTDLGLGPSELGLLTSTYFLAMAVVQLPFGILLDRHGPRRVQSGCLIVAAVGATIFAMSHTLSVLLLGRTLIGIGLSTALMAGLKAIVLWFPPARVASANGLLVTLGALGAVTATAPAQGLVDAFGWRGLFLLLAAATVVCAATIFLVVPERDQDAMSGRSTGQVTLCSIYRDKRFWKLAPMSAMTIGSAWAIQGLWAAPWLGDVEGFDRPTVVRHLLVMAIALSLGGVALGRLADKIRHRGISTEALFCAIAAVSVAAQLAVILRWPIPSYVLWSVIAVAGAATVLSYAILPGYFPKKASGRANAALNLLHLSVAFAVQWVTGVIIGLWPMQNGSHPAEAYQVAFGLNLAVQAASIAWFAIPRRASLRLRPRLSVQIPQLLGAHRARSSRFHYREARRVWLARVCEAEAQRLFWRRTALGSVLVSVLLTGSVVLSISGPPIAVHVIAAEQPTSADFDVSIASRR